MDILRLSFSWEGGWGGGAWEVSGRDGERERVSLILKQKLST